MSRLWGSVALLASSSTLVCCVIPALLVTMGFGATLAGIISTFPQLTFLSEHKLAVFSVAALMLAAAGYARSRPEAQTCPSDPVLAEACRRSKKLGGILFYIATLLFALSGLFVWYFSL